MPRRNVPPPNRNRLRSARRCNRRCSRWGRRSALRTSPSRRKRSGLYGSKRPTLHIFHTLKVLAHRPNHLLVDVSGDDGPTKLIYDGKTLVLFRPGDKHYASIPVPDTIRGMMEVALGRFGIDFPLADFLTDAPDQAFLAGVTSGTEVNTVTIDGVPCRHLFFMQPPGIELELWLEKSEQVLPRRLIVTYRSMQGQPSFVAEFSDWNFSVHPSDAEFAFQPPEGAVKVELKPATAEKRKGGKS